MVVGICDIQSLIRINVDSSRSIQLVEFAALSVITREHNPLVLVFVPPHNSVVDHFAYLHRMLSVYVKPNRSPNVFLSRSCLLSTSYYLPVSRSFLKTHYSEVNPICHLNETIPYVHSFWLVQLICFLTPFTASSNYSAFVVSWPPLQDPVIFSVSHLHIQVNVCLRERRSLKLPQFISGCSISRNYISLNLFSTLFLNFFFAKHKNNYKCCYKLKYFLFKKYH